MASSMLGEFPKRIGIAEAEVLLRSLGYRTAREPFELVAFKRIDKAERFHVKLETFGQDAIPRGAKIDVHVDRMPEIKKYHTSVAHDPRIEAELMRILSLSKERSWSPSSKVACPMCGRAVVARFLANHLKMHHGARR